MRIKQILFIALIAAMVLPACKKYEEGPVISLRSKKARVVNVWKVDAVYSSGVNITNDYLQTHVDQKTEFRDNGEFIETYKDNLGVVRTINGTWAFDSGKEKLNITVIGITLSYDIIRLKEKEMWLKITLSAGGAGIISEFRYVPA
jgi:hypothetical protein